ncbi:glycosyltransferase family 2 protein [Novosphingobium gossypii]|uniref:glycosyltransferase n=1 Tax=Novosphingobium gossypii TaxID=1604774 RepID=UPI003D20F946
MTPPVCVCVPARNEASHIGSLIEALAEQTTQVPFTLVVCVNNSSDKTRAVAVEAALRFDARFQLEVIEREFEPALAHAGSARRAAMNLGAEIAGIDGWLISTDADCRPPASWLEANLAQMAADRIVGGRIELDEREATTDPTIFALRARFDAYWHAVRAIEDAIDPVAWDMPPRHGDHTGASLALSVDLYRRAGGVPLLPTGEDRALVEAAMKVGGKLVHPVTVWTRASSRTAGRAAGGMAADMQRWIDHARNGDAPLVPALSHWEARARWRSRAKRELSPDAWLDAERALPAMPCDMPLPAMAAVS